VKLAKKDKNYSPSQLKVIHQEVKENKISIHKIAEYLGINRKKVRKILVVIERGGDMVCERGRPKLISSRCGEEIKEEIKSAILHKSAKTTVELTTLFNEKAIKTDESMGKNGLNKLQGMSKRTERNYRKQLCLPTVQGQTTTEARKLASLDIRNFISMATMNEVLGENLGYHCMGNLDATQFRLQFKNKAKLVSIEKCTIPVTRTEESTLDLFIKQFFLVSAAGFSAPPLYVLAEKSIKEGECIVVKIKGLAFGLDSVTNGYIVFCNSRTKLDKFNEFLWRTYVIDFVTVSRSRQEENSNFYLVLDGEATQIGALDNQDTKNLLSNNNIDIGKGPASCSGVCGNALDCGNLFKAVKTTLKGKESLVARESMNSELESIIYKQTKITKYITRGRRRKIAVGIVALLYAELKTMHPEIIKNGFRKIGMIGQNRLNTTLGCCPSIELIPPQQIKVIKEKFKDFVGLFKTHGEVKESYYDELKIVKREDFERDELVVYRQRAVWLTNIESLERRKKYLEAQQNELKEAEIRRLKKEEEKEKNKEEKREKAVQREKKRKLREEKKQEKLEKEEEKKYKRRKLNGNNGVQLAHPMEDDKGEDRKKKNFLPAIMGKGDNRRCRKILFII
jgi:predicted transcriptional regulator